MNDANETINSSNPAYRVLARKYRPADFTALIGQEPMVRTLTNAFETGRIAQAWMLTGVRGVGKTTTARILARALNYATDDIDQPHMDLTTPGVHCEAIMEGHHVDIVEMDAASHTGIDDIKQIIDSVRYAPVSARYKVYIIDEIHMLSEKAFNALLKTLEEPPPHAKFIFATTEIRKVPITVLSRCQRFDLRRVDAQLLSDHLKKIAEAEGVQVDEQALAMVSRAAEGSVRDALSILDQAIAHTNGDVDAENVRAMLGLADRTRIVDLFEHLVGGNIAEALETFKGLYDVGADPIVVLNDLADFTHLVTRLRFVKSAAATDITLSPDEQERGTAFAEKLPVPVLARTWQMLLKGIQECEQAARPFAAGEMLLIRLAHAATLPTLDEAIKKMDQAIADAPMPSVSTTPLPMGAASSSGSPPVSDAPPNAVGGGAPAGPPVTHGPSMQQQRAVGDDVQVGMAEPQIGEITTPKIKVRSLQDIADLAEKNRDPLFKVNVRRFVRLVSIEPGQLEVVLTQDAPPRLISDLSSKLQNWTGERWFVTPAREGGGQTLQEQESEKRDALLASAAQDSETAKLLSAFPGARIVDVRLGDTDMENEIPLDTGEGDFDAPMNPDDD